MRRQFFAIALSLSFIYISCKDIQQKAEITSGQTTKLLFPKGEKITNANFTGNAWLHQMVMADTANLTQVGSVTFESGARTKWHLHPAGQILIIINGTGYYQEKGTEKKIIRAGEVVKCTPNVAHWHGASKDEQLVQIAVTNTQKGAPVWLEAVTDEEYNK
jgi:quercetin dioxygenase-like cupin family protein